MMKNEYRLTVMLTSYNQKQILKENIESLIDQHENTKFKLLISDDHSTDGSYQMLLELEEQHDFITVVKPETKKAVGNNRNTLLENVNTDYALFIDGDDPQKDDFLPAINEAIKTNKLMYHLSGFLEITPLYEKQKFTSDYENVCLYVYSKQLCETLRFDEELIIGEDYHFSIKYYEILYFDFEVIDVFYSYRRFFNPNSLSSISNVHSRYSQEKKILEKINEYYLSSDYVTRKINEKKFDVLNYALLCNEKVEDELIASTKMRLKYALFYYLYHFAKRTKTLKIYTWIFRNRINGSFNVNRFKKKSSQ